MMQKKLHYLQKVDYGSIHNATWYIHTNIQAHMRALISHQCGVCRLAPIRGLKFSCV